MIRTILFSVFAMLLISNNSLAQGFKGLNFGLFGYGSIGGGNITTSGLSEILTSFDLITRDVSISSTNLGLGGSFTSRQFVLTVHGGFDFLHSPNSIETKVNRSSSSANINIGYVVYRHNYTQYYPSVGIGNRLNYMSIENKRGSDKMFGEVIIGSSQTEKFELQNSFLDISLNSSSFNSPFSYVPLGYQVNVSIGYQFSLSKSKWKSVTSNEVVNLVPATSTNGIYIRLQLGGGLFM